MSDLLTQIHDEIDSPEEVRSLVSMVNEFMDAFEVDRSFSLWLKLVKEERDEVRKAVKDFSEDPSHANAVEVLKEACDLAYVWSGLTISVAHLYDNTPDDVSLDDDTEANLIEAAMLGSEVEGLFRLIAPTFSDEARVEAFKRVHASNMSKLGDDGKPIKRADGKVVKGPNYKPPVLDDLVPVFDRKGLN